MNENLPIEKKYQSLLEENQKLKNEINELKQKYEPKSNRYSTSSPIAISSTSSNNIAATATTSSSSSTLNGNSTTTTTITSVYQTSSSSPASSPTSSNPTISPSPTSSSSSSIGLASSPSSSSIALATSPINISSSPSSPISHQPISVSHSNSSSEDLIASANNSKHHSKKDRSNSNEKDKDSKVKDHTDSNSKGGDKEKRKTGMGKKLFSKLLDPSKKSSGSSLNLLGGNSNGSGSKKESSSSSIINHQELINGTGNEADFLYQEKGLSRPYKNLPKLEVIPVSGDRNTKISHISGPDYQSGTVPVTSIGSPMIKYPSSFTERLYCISTSTYPFLPNTTERAGDPIADRYTCAVYNNRLITCLADGCNWGQKPKEAAQNASTAFIDYVISKNDEMTNVKEVGKILFNAFECAHKSIMLGKDEFWEAGTTTLLGGVLLEINKGSDKWSPQWEFVCASVGDCKAYLLSQGEITDITEDNRNNLDAKDCGGRLGPHLEQGKPDLRNLNIFCASVYDEDIIMIVSDGVHDNLDPKHLGKTPNDMSKEFNLNGEKWTDVDFSKAQSAKNAFTASLLETLVADSTDPSEISNRVLEHCWNTTVASRFFMENNAGKRLPEDYSRYPGKMDHTSIICFKAGSFGQKGCTSPTTVIGTPSIVIDPHSNTISGEPFQHINIPSSQNINNKTDWIKVSPSTNKYNTPLKKTSSETNVFPSQSSTIGRVSISATSNPDLSTLKVSDGSDSGDSNVVNSSDSSPRYK
ncbi:hypothetical protein RB653_002494 [Dictyostelium firmibasis]|uniref:PPM-type phosphatase domain-containing protein n=1 Tax=Dictyostelium firmibasis TaxID=79012 RepID=A0AAN7YSR6_9MYCE